MLYLVAHIAVYVNAMGRKEVQRQVIICLCFEDIKAKRSKNCCKRRDVKLKTFILN